MKGKDKCKILKEIRREIAEQNDIEWVVSECSHKGECKGTCPRCESEVRKLERELALRRKLGKAVALVGISAACLTGLAACSGIPGTAENDLSGAVPYADSSSDDIEMLDGEVGLDSCGLDGDVINHPYPEEGPVYELSGYVAD